MIVSVAVKAVKCACLTRRCSGRASRAAERQTRYADILSSFISSTSFWGRKELLSTKGSKKAEGSFCLYFVRTGC